MGAWADEAQSQRKGNARGQITTEGALARVAYWVEEMGGESKNRGQWVPLVLKIIKEAPKRKIITPTGFSGPLARAAFGKLSNPPVTNDVRAELFDFMRKAGGLLDLIRPKDEAPKFSFKERELQAATLSSIAQSIAKPKKSGSGALVLLALAFLASEDMK